MWWWRRKREGLGSRGRVIVFHQHALKTKLTSELPRPNPLITLPSSRKGNGGWGPSSGPAIVSRGPSGRMAAMAIVESVHGWWMVAQ